MAFATAVWGKKTVLFPSTLEGEADGIQKSDCFHISTVLWKCGKILTPLCQGAKDQTHFHHHEKKKSTLYGKRVTVSSVNNCMCCGWPLKYKVNQLLLGLVK